MSEPGADRKQIELEYRDLKPKLAAAVIAAEEWNQRTGLTSLTTQYEAAERAENTAAMRLARTKPTTPAGAGALVAYEGRLNVAARHMPSNNPHSAAVNYRAAMEAGRQAGGAEGVRGREQVVRYPYVYPYKNRELTHWY